MIEGPSFGCVGGIVWVMMYFDPLGWYWTDDVPFSYTVRVLWAFTVLFG